MISASEARSIANEYHQRGEMDIICEQIQNESLRGHYQTTIHGIENTTHARHIRSELNDLGYFAEIKKTNMISYNYDDVYDIEISWF